MKSEHVRFSTPEWLDWAIPVCLLASILAVGRYNPPLEESPAELITKARRATEAGRPKDALETTVRLLEFFPKNHIYLEQAARLSAQLGRPLEEAAYLERYTLSSPDPGEACPEWPHSYWRAGEKAKMLDAATRCLAFEPTNSDFSFDLALAHERAGQMQKALAFYETGKTKYPGYADFSIGHARLLLRTGQPQDAFNEISIVLQEHPKLADAELVAALSADQIGEKDRALEIFAAAVKNHPENVELKDAFANFYRQPGAKP